MRKAGWIGAALCVAAGSAAAGEAIPKETVSLSGAWALYPMAVRWGEEYQKRHPHVRFDISAGGAGKGMTDALAGAVDIGLVSREINAAEIDKGALAFAVTKDAVVAVVSARNPVLAKLRRRGATRDALAGLWLGNGATHWGGFVAGGEQAPIRVYTRSDACGAAETWAKFLGKRQEDLKGIGVYGDPGLAEAVRRDPLGIGYNNVNFAYDAKSGRPVAGLEVLPLDVDGNGAVDPKELVYATQKDLVAAIVRGDYPSPPARDLYFVTKGVPAKPPVRAFIRWVLTDGQAWVGESGYIGLTPGRLEEGLSRLDAGR